MLQVFTMKKIVSAIFLLALSAGLVLSLSGCGEAAPSGEELSALVSEAILSDNASGFADGECSAEGHRILGSSLSGDRLRVYALTTYGNYGFRNDMFIKISGTGVIPTVLTFEKNTADWELADIEYPRDGNEYVSSIKRLFPLKYRFAALHPGDKAYDEISAQERCYAEAYLESIGREAEIGEFRDLNTVLLTDLGVSVDVSNELSCDKRLWQYPWWIGTIETPENGTRYIRSLSYDEEAGLIIYETAEKESGSVTERFVFDSATGKEAGEADR